MFFISFNEFNLDSRLNTAIKRAGFHKLAPIQTAAIPHALAGHDLIGTAQTGTGKTAAFILPILHILLTSPGKRTRALIITPTRELAVVAAGEKAHDLAEAAGAEAGCVLSINENTWSYFSDGWWGRNNNLWTQNTVQNIPSGTCSGDSSEFGPVNLGQISVRAEVNASYSLQ